MEKFSNDDLPQLRQYKVNKVNFSLKKVNKITELDGKCYKLILIQAFKYCVNNHKDPDKVAKISAWIPLVNSPRKIRGIGITNGTNDTSTATTSSSASILPKSRKLKDNGFVKSSRILIGNSIGVG